MGKVGAHHFTGFTAALAPGPLFVWGFLRVLRNGLCPGPESALSVRLAAESVARIVNWVVVGL